MVSLQHIFDEAYLGLMSQGFERSFEDAGCKYRGRYGMKCAIGWNIPDHLYDISMERTARGELFKSLFPGINSEEIAELKNLQAAHDLNYQPGAMKDALEKHATKYSRTIPTQTRAREVAWVR